MSSRFRTIVEQTEQGYSAWLLGPGVAVVGQGATAKQAHDSLRAAIRSAAKEGEDLEPSMPILATAAAEAPDTACQEGAPAKGKEARFPIQLRPKYLKDATGKHVAAIVSEREYESLLDAVEDAYWSSKADQVKSSGERPVRFEPAARRPARAKK